MKITSAAIRQYSLQLTKPLTTDKSQTTRQGLVLTLYSDTGLKSYGEIAPLPGLHKENLSEATEQILEYSSHLSRMPFVHDILSFDGCISKYIPDDLYPSVRSGIEMAIVDMALQISPLLNSLPESLPINALLVAEKNSIAEQVDELLMQGFSCIKMKLGLQSVEKDISDVNTILSHIKNKATLRLDANRRWTLQQAIQFCKEIDMENIEYIEEPIQSKDEHSQLIQSCSVPIALDETLAEIPCGQLDETCYRAVVLKPSVLGGFEKTTQIVRWAKRHHITPVISSAFQTSLATRIYLIFTAINGITKVPLGLDTGKWFQEDLPATPFFVEAGRIALNPLIARPELRQHLLKVVETRC